MDDNLELQALRRDLQQCLHRAEKLKLGIAGTYISHALEHVDFVKSKKPAPPKLRSLTGGKAPD